MLSSTLKLKVYIFLFKFKYAAKQNTSNMSMLLDLRKKPVVSNLSQKNMINFIAAL